MNIEEIETLAFTYDWPFHTSQRHSKLSMNHLGIWKHLGKNSNGELRNSTLVNDGTLRSTADFASALSNVNNVKISDLLEFLLMLFFFSPLFSPENHLQKVARLWKHPWGKFFFDNLKKYLAEDFFHFHLQLCKNSWMATFLWSYLL